MPSLPGQEGEIGADVWHRLLFVLPDLGLRAFGMFVMPHPPALAEYDGAQHIYYLDALSDREKAMAVLHELGHAYLHPPGRGDFAPDQLDQGEEQLVHNAAAQACERLGLSGYVAAMAARGAPERLLVPVAPDSQPQVNEIAAYLEAVVRDYRQPPLWPNRG